ncbi:hypothetical protein ABK040_015418 [Willaertia magna]
MSATPVLDFLSKDDWFSVFQFLSLQELCNCCLISKEFNEIVNENKCWKFHFLQFSNSPIDKKREINEDNMNWKSLLKNNFSKYSIRLSQSLGIYFKELNDNYIKNKKLYSVYDLQKLKDQYSIGLKNNLEITKYIKDPFILQSIKVLLNRIKILNCYLSFEEEGKLISGNYKEVVSKLNNFDLSKYELKFTLQISGMKNNLILRIQNAISDFAASLFFDDFFVYDYGQCDYIIWINYENNDFTTEELKLGFTKRDKSKGFWFIKKTNGSFVIHNNLNILDLILTEIIPVRNVSHLNASNFKPLFVLLLSKIEELFISNRENAIDKLFLNWPKNEEYLLLNNDKLLKHDNLLLNDILLIQRKESLQLILNNVYNSFCEDLKNMIIKKNWGSYKLKDVDVMKRYLFKTILYIKDYKEKLEFGLGMKIIDDNTFTELIDSNFNEKKRKEICSK